MNTKAAVLHKIKMDRPYHRSKPLKIENVILDNPGFNEVIIKIKAAGLCHSDLSVINGNRPRPLPMVLGHEAAGEVVELGKGVKKLKLGDNVVFAFLPSCGNCNYCQTGRAALCEPGSKANSEGTLLGGNRKIKNNGQYYFHHLGVSAFAEYSVVSVDSLVKVDSDIPFEIAALFGCAVMTGVGSVVNTANLKLGQSVLIIGLGGVGLSAVLGAKAAGASKIIAADIRRDKRDLAEKLGADFTFDSTNKKALELLKDLTNGGVDVAFEFAGVIQALNFAYHSTKKGGITITAALPNPKARFELSPVDLVGQEKTIKGSYLGSCIPSRDIPAYIELYKSGRLAVEKLISSRLKLEEINNGFELLAKGDTVRQIILFN